jgi:hypothetical protein
LKNKSSKISDAICPVRNNVPLLSNLAKAGLSLNSLTALRSLAGFPKGQARTGKNLIYKLIQILGCAYFMGKMVKMASCKKKKG